MPLFRYEARDREGKLQADSLEAPNVRAAVQALQAQGLTVLQIKEELSCPCGHPSPPAGKACEKCGRVAPNSAGGVLKLLVLAGLAGLVGHWLGLY